MASIIPGYEYDVFISYRHNDNRSGWVTEFASALQEELAATIKEPISVYFDTNPHDGLLETHNVDKSLENKLKCLIFIPIISQTYCDPKSFAWQNEFCSFNKYAREDQFGLDIKLSNGNVASRILPVKIHDLDKEDTILLETELGGVLRAIEFIFKSPGVNRPLTPSDNPDKNQNQTFYRDQINKVANAIHDIIRGIKDSENSITGISNEFMISQARKVPFKQKLTGRNVLRASLVYILTALIFWKVLIISSDLFNLTENTIRLITLFLIVLFPLAILMAWIYERSPQGFIRTGSVASLVNPYPDTKKKPFTSYTFISLLLVTLAVLFLLFPQTKRAYSSDSNQNVEKSIAVLPFEDMSASKDQEYLGDGIAEEIINVLTRIEGLHVIGRTSSFSFKGKSDDLITIGSKLGAKTILEGSVRKSNNQIRVTAQLIDAKNGSHIWSETYDRELIDIFKIQDDISARIAERFEASLNSSRALAPPTKNTDAYEMYLRGKQAMTRGIAEAESARDYLEKAIRFDSTFVLAYAALSQAYFNLRIYDIGDSDWSYKLSRSAALNAIALDPKSYAGYIELSMINFIIEWDWAATKTNYHKALSLGLPQPDSYKAYYLSLIGHNDESIQIMKDVLKQDPLSVEHLLSLSRMYIWAGRYSDAIANGEKILTLDPDNTSNMRHLGQSYLFSGNPQKALIQYSELWKKDPTYAPDGFIGSLMRLGRREESLAVLYDMPNSVTSVKKAICYIFLNEPDSAFKHLEEGYKKRETLLSFLQVEPAFQLIKDDPRYKTLLKKMNFPKDF